MYFSSGNLWLSELVNLNFDRVLSKDSVDLKINQSKTDQAKKGFVFRILLSHVKYILCYVELFDIKDRFDFKDLDFSEQ
jgi:hypothetical protein